MRRILILGLFIGLLGANSAPRIVALVPSFGDDLFAIGAAHVVGVCKFTDETPQERAIPVVADFQSVDTERIVALRPDVVVGTPNQAPLVASLKRAGLRVVLIKDDTYDDIFTDVQVLGDLSGRRSAAAALASRLRAETAQLHAKAMRFTYHPRVFFALGSGPIWTAGRDSYLGTLLRLAGARNVADDLATPWGEYSAEALLRAQPDAIVAGHDTDLASVTGREPWRSLSAVRNGNLFIPDQRTTDALYRPGPHYNEGLRWLIERLSPLSTPKTQSAH